MKYSDSLERATTRREGPVVTRWSDAEFKRQRDKDLEIESITTRQVLTAVGLCMVTAALLTSGTLLESAERRSFGNQRDALVAVAEPLDRIANFLSLNRPADAIADIRSDSNGPLTDPLQVSAADQPATDVVPTAASPVVPASPAPEPVAVEEETPEEDPEPIRAVSEVAPLVVHVAGDSQAEFPGQALTNRSVNGVLDYQVTADSRIATGLARPDYFNWPAELLQIDESVEAVVLFFGGNDFQDMELAGERLVRGTDLWVGEYRRRIEVTLDLLESPGRIVFWVAPPPVRDGDTSAAIADMNAEVRGAAATRPWVAVVDADERFAPDGRFVAYLPDASGVDTRVRSGDGVHFTPKGASWVADMIVADIERFWTFRTN